jgi:hypothetical protein
VPDEITNAELGRQLEALHRELHDDLGDIKRQLAQYVLQAVYNAEMAARDRRIDGLERDVKAAEEQRRTLVRWVVSAIVVPSVVLLAQIVLALQGPT